MTAPAAVGLASVTPKSGVKPSGCTEPSAGRLTVTAGAVRSTWNVRAICAVFATGVASSVPLTVTA